jgi:hypothetical protein
MEYRNELVQIGLVISGILIVILLAIAFMYRPPVDDRRVDAYEEPVHVVTDAAGTHVEPAAP